MLLKIKKFCIGNKKSKGEYIHVKDAAKISVEILNKKFVNKCLMLTGKKSIKIINFLKYWQVL